MRHTPKTIWDRLAAEHLTDLRIRDIWYEGGGTFGIDEILHAVNCHDDLLTALQGCIPWLESMPLPPANQDYRDEAAKALEAAFTAVAKAEAKQ